MKKVEAKRTASRMTYYVDGKRASLKAATQAEEYNHSAIINSLLDAYEKAQDVESVAVKNDDFNPRANAGVFVATIFAEFAWQAVPAPRGKKTDTDALTIKRGYKNLVDAVNAVRYVKKNLGRDFYNSGYRFMGAIVLKDFECWWQVLYREGKEITRINAKCHEIIA